jgi:phosphoenolpyruvate carboxykinase (ATP)
MELYDNATFLEKAQEVKLNLSVRQLVEEAIRNGEGTLTDKGSLRVETGKHTGRSPKDKFIVDAASTHDKVSWSNNQPCSEETFDRLYKKMVAYVQEHRLYATDVYAGADTKYRLRVRMYHGIRLAPVICAAAFYRLHRTGKRYSPRFYGGLPAGFKS